MRAAAAAIDCGSLETTPFPQEGAGGAAGGGNGALAAQVAPPLRLCPWTLRLAPPAAEAAFWRCQSASAAYTSVDKAAFVLGNLNLFTAWMATNIFQDPLYRIAMRAWLAACVAGAAAAWACLAYTPGRYARARTAIVGAQRVFRGLWTLVAVGMSTQSGWAAIMSRTGAVAPGPAILQALSLLGVFWVMQPLLFPFAFRVTGPIQVVFCAYTCWGFRTLACAAAEDARYALAARSLCRAALGAKQYLVLAAGGGAGAAAAGAPRGELCEEAPVELLIALTSSLACLIPLHLLYWSELRLKERFVSLARQDTFAPSAPSRLHAALGATLSPAAMHACAALWAVLLSFVAAEAAVKLGGPSSCPGPA